MHIFRINIRLGQKYIKFKAATLLNKLPLKIKVQRSINIFQAQLKTYLLPGLKYFPEMLCTLSFFSLFFLCFIQNLGLLTALY